MSPPLNYDFFAPPRITFGWGRRRELGTIAKALGRRAFLVCGSKTLEAGGALDELCASLAGAGVAAESLGTISREPEVADVDQFTKRLLECQPTADDFVLAVRRSPQWPRIETPKRFKTFWKASAEDCRSLVFH
jgi:alcohol dehydrogenase class IV